MMRALICLAAATGVVSVFVLLQNRSEPQGSIPVVQQPGENDVIPTVPAPAKEPQVKNQNSQSTLPARNSSYEASIEAVDKALRTSNPTDANEAAKVLASCADINERVTGAYTVTQEHASDHRRAALLQDLLDSQQLRQRACQSLADKIHLRPKFLEIAAKGGVVGAAVDYWTTVSRDPAPPWVISGVANDANHGDLSSMFHASLAGNDLQIDPVTAEAYRRAISIAAQTTQTMGAASLYARILPATASDRQWDDDTEKGIQERANELFQQIRAREEEKLRKRSLAWQS